MNLTTNASHPEFQYLDILSRLLDERTIVNPKGSVFRPDRTGTGTYGLFGEQMRFDLAEGFPLLTTKKLHIRSILVELLWMLRGDTNTKFLHDQKVSIWDEWANENGDLGPVYGKQWRSWRGYPYGPDGDIEYIDQIQTLIKDLVTNPYSRRHVVSAWNVADLPDMSLAPCHCLFQFHVKPAMQEDRWIVFGNQSGGWDFDPNDDEAYANKLCDEADIPTQVLSLRLDQRSADWFLGVPFNTASYAAFLILMAREVKMIPGEFIHQFGDLHLYSNHVEQARLQLERTPLNVLPTLEISGEAEGLSMFDLKYEHFILSNYEAHPSIKAEVSK